MITEYIQMREDAIDEAAIRRAGKILRGGGLVAFPTETVYGLGGDALQAESSRKIYAAKGRPSDNPLIVHICRLEDLPAITASVPREAIWLARTYWPGPLTMILPRSELVPKETTGGLDTVAVRFPSNRIAMALIDAAGGYVAAPSANRSGRPSPTLAQHCREDLDGRVEMIIDGGQVGIGLESTIIDLTEGRPTILRPGFITQQMLEKTIGEVQVDSAIIAPDSGKAPKAPGMKYRHYAPKGTLEICEGSRNDVIAYINAQTQKLHAQGYRTGVICTDETGSAYRADVICSTGSRSDETAAARELFRILRDMDSENVQFIFSESFGDGPLGQAVMNRLMKAAGHRVTDVPRKSSAFVI